LPDELVDEMSDFLGGSTEEVDEMSSFLGEAAPAPKPQEEITHGDMISAFLSLEAATGNKLLPDDSSKGVDMERLFEEGMSVTEINEYQDRVESDPDFARKHFEEKVKRDFSEMLPHLKTKEDINRFSDEILVHRANVDFDRRLRQYRQHKIAGFDPENFASLRGFGPDGDYGARVSLDTPDQLVSKLSDTIGGRGYGRDNFYYGRRPTTPKQAREYLAEMERRQQKADREDEERLSDEAPGLITSVAQRAVGATPLGALQPEEMRLWVDRGFENLRDKVGFGAEVIESASYLGGALSSMGPVRKIAEKAALSVGLTGKAAAKVVPALTMALYASPEAIRSRDAMQVLKAAGLGALSPVLIDRIQKGLRRLPVRMQSAVSEAFQEMILGQVIHGDLTKSSADGIVGLMFGGIVMPDRAKLERAKAIPEIRALRNAKFAERDRLRAVEESNRAIQRGIDEKIFAAKRRSKDKSLTPDRS
jgi:hypothetical protein